jgi:hypothetical protein
MLLEPLHADTIAMFRRMLASPRPRAPARRPLPSRYP